MAERDLPSPDELRQLLRYEPETGKLFWLKREPHQFPSGVRRNPHAQCAHWNSIYAGREAGRGSGAARHLVVCVLGRTLKYHRVAWCIHFGEWPRLHIDHINGDTSDNRVCNLRDVPRRLNARNRRRPSTNVSGMAGVSWRAQEGKWMAKVRADGQEYYLGRFQSLDDAKAAVLTKRQEIGGFTADHGIRD